MSLLNNRAIFILIGIVFFVLACITLVFGVIHILVKCPDGDKKCKINHESHTIWLFIGSVILFAMAIIFGVASWK